MSCVVDWVQLVLFDSAEPGMSRAVVVAPSAAARHADDDDGERELTRRRVITLGRGG